MAVRILIQGVAIVVLASIWIALAGKAVRAELIAATAAALFAVVVLEATRRVGRVRLGPPQGAWPFIASAPRKIARGAHLAFVVLARRIARGNPPRSRFVNKPLPGRTKAFRSVVTWSEGIGPDTYVVHIDPWEGRELVHELERRSTA